MVLSNIGYNIETKNGDVYENVEIIPHSLPSHYIDVYFADSIEYTKYENVILLHNEGEVKGAYFWAITAKYFRELPYEKALELSFAGDDYILRYFNMSPSGELFRG